MVVAVAVVLAFLVVACVMLAVKLESIETAVRKANDMAARPVEAVPAKSTPSRIGRMYSEPEKGPLTRFLELTGAPALAAAVIGIVALVGAGMVGDEGNEADHLGPQVAALEASLDSMRTSLQSTRDSLRLAIQRTTTSAAVPPRPEQRRSTIASTSADRIIPAPILNAPVTPPSP